jgi:MFS family permease
MVMNTSLFNRNFTLVICGQIVSVLGSAILRFALDLYVLDITGRADIFALVLALSMIPGIVFTPIGGALADRFNRRNLMVILDFSAGAVVLILLMLLSAGLASIVAIGIILGLLSLISSGYQPTVQASVPNLVPADKLGPANGMVNGIGALSGMLGPVIGGVLYAVIGLNMLVILSCIAFFLSALMEIFIRMPFEKRSFTGSLAATILTDTKEGLRYIVDEKPLIVRVIILAALFNLLLTPLFIIGIPYVLRVTMQSGETLYGLGIGIGQFSAILGAIVGGALASKLKLHRLYLVLIAIACVCVLMAVAVFPAVLGLGFSLPFSLFVGSGGVIMILITLINIFVFTFVQINTPNEMLGKVMAIILASANCATPLGQALYGLIFERFNEAVFIPVLCAAGFAVLIAITTKMFFKSNARHERVSSGVLETELH